MYKYYARASLCIAYLDGVDELSADRSMFEHATCFSRGWTLQELIAPRDLRFLNRCGDTLGTKASLSCLVSLVCGIAEQVLRDPLEMVNICMSEKMPWAAKRTTTRPEDEAYSLMGIFGVNMPPIHGEGVENAFRRLQFEILRTTPDQTLFAWECTHATGEMLASRVSHFANGAQYTPDKFSDGVYKVASHGLGLFTGVLLDISKPDFNMTNVGLHISLPVASIPRYPAELTFAFLACRTKKSGELVAVCLHKRVDAWFSSYFRSAFNARTVYHFAQPTKSRPYNPQIMLKTAWISRSSVQDKSVIENLMGILKRVRFELWTKSEQAYTQIYCSNRSQVRTKRFWHDTAHCGPDDRSSIRKFMASDLPVQHLVSGMFPTNEFLHEVVAFGGDAGLNIAFMEVERNIWFRVGIRDPHGGEEGFWSTPTELLEEEAYQQLLHDYSFFVGAYWNGQVSGRISEEMLRGPRATFSTAKTFGNQNYTIEAIISDDVPEEISLKIFLVAEQAGDQSKLLLPSVL